MKGALLDDLTHWAHFERAPSISILNQSVSLVIQVDQNPSMSLNFDGRFNHDFGFH